MIQNLVALGNCLKSGSNRGTGTDGTALSSPEGVSNHRMPLRDSGLLASLWLAISAPSLEPFCEHAFGGGDCF